MGYIRHDAIVVTTSVEHLFINFVNFAMGIGANVLIQPVAGLNNYRSALVCPDGSKEDWPDSNNGNARRANIRQWLTAQRYEDGSNPFEWVEVSYGSDDKTAIVQHSEWAT